MVILSCFCTLKITGFAEGRGQKERDRGRERDGGKQGEREGGREGETEGDRKGGGRDREGGWRNKEVIGIPLLKFQRFSINKWSQFP